MQTNKSKKANLERKKAQFIQIVNKKEYTEIYAIFVSTFAIFDWIRIHFKILFIFVVEIVNCVQIAFYSIKYRYVRNPEWSCNRINHPSQQNVMSSALNYI